MKKTIFIAGLMFILHFAGMSFAQSLVPVSGRSDVVYPALTGRMLNSGHSGLRETGFQAVQRSTELSDNSPVLFGATSLGVFTQGEIPLHNNRYYIKLSVIDVDNGLLYNGTPFGTASLRTLLVPAQIGTHVPILRERLGEFEYVLSGDASAGVLLGWAFPTDGTFFGYSMPNSRFASGASAYMGIGNTVKVSRFVGLYLNGGVSYFNLFSHFVLPQSQYIVPSVSVGFYFGLGAM